MEKEKNICMYIYIWIYIYMCVYIWSTPPYIYIFKYTYIYTPLKLTCPLKGGHFKRKVVFQPWFSGAMLVLGGIHVHIYIWLIYVYVGIFPKIYQCKNQTVSKPKTCTPNKQLSPSQELLVKVICSVGSWCYLRYPDVHGFVFLYNPLNISIR